MDDEQRVELAAILDETREVLEKAPGWIDRGQAATVLTTVAHLEEVLEVVLICYMRPIDKKMWTRLFEGYGPLSTLAARIDIAYAFGILSDDEFKDLGIIRKIRNRFAHSRKVLSFEDNDIELLVNQLHCPDAKADTSYRRFFATLFGVIREIIKVAEEARSGLSGRL